MTASIASQTKTEAETASRKRGCLFYVKRGLLSFAMLLIALLVLGFSYQTIAAETDKQNYPPRGQFFTVNGHRMHIYCVGEGNPTIVLEAGGYANSLWWYRIQRQLAEHTQVCAYDRPGLGWSEPTVGSRDAITITSELHSLLEQAGVSVPYIMAGHSYGAILTRIYASRFPDEIAGIALVDTGLLIPKHYTQSEFEAWKASNDAIQAFLWGATHFGLMRLITPGDFRNYGFPSEIAAELGALRSSNVSFDTDYAERFPGRLVLNEASASAENLANLPIAILWAPEGLNIPAADREAYADLQREISTYSSNTLMRTIEGANHGSILGNEQYAQQVTNAILEVIDAVQTGELLAQSSSGKR